MPREDDRVVWQRVDLSLDRALELVEVPLGQVRPPDAGPEEGVAHEGRLGACKIKEDVAGAVAGHVAYLHGLPQGLQTVALTHPVVDPDRFQLQVLTQEFRHDRGTLVKDPVRLMGDHLCLGAPHHLGRPLGMIPVPVGKPKRLQGASLPMQDGLNLIPNSFWRIN